MRLHQSLPHTVKSAHARDVFPAVITGHVCRRMTWSISGWTFTALEAHYHTLVKYLNFQDQGMVLGKGCGTPSMTAGSKYMEQAYKLGKALT